MILTVSAALALTLGCGGDDATTPAGNTPSGGTTDKIAGIAVPASSRPLCTSATGGVTTAISGSNPRVLGFSWSAAPAGTATHYAVKFTKAKGNTTDVISERLVKVDEMPREVKAPMPLDEGSYYAISGLVVKDGSAVCVMDGINGISN